MRWSMMRTIVVAVILAAGCGDGGTGGLDSGTDASTDSDTDSDADTDADSGPADAGSDAGEDAGPCPADMALNGDVCIDLYEAPNQADAWPLVMFSFTEADAWCAARGKRLCFDDEWSEFCGGPDGWDYPYGDAHVPGQCNDDEAWIADDADLLDGWPADAGTPDVTDWEELLAAVQAMSPEAEAAANHVAALYQADPSGANPGCTNAAGAFDLQGNAEEWTRRSDGGEPGFHGSLQGGYWSEPKTCTAGVTSHGDDFRIYRAGFRCCAGSL